MTADEHVINARNAMETAIKELSEVVINRVTGKFTNDRAYRTKLRNILNSLIAAREDL
jgi:hypothetical protein